MQNIKKICLALLVLAAGYLVLLILFFPSVSIEREDSADPGQLLTVWGDDDSIVKAFQEYQKTHQGVELSFVYVSKDDYNKKLETTISTSGKLPDICFLSGENYDYLKEIDLWENLLEAPYNLDREDLLDSNLVANQKGQIVAVPYYITAAGMAYCKSLAAKTIGNDSPEYMSSRFSTWADLISEGKRMKRESREEFHLFASIQDPGIILWNQTDEAYVEDGILRKPDRFYNYFKVLTTLRDNQLVSHTSQWSPSWYHAVEQRSTLFFPCPIWLPETGLFQGDFPDWGLMSPPGGSFEWGKTAWAIPESSACKELAWEFTRSFLLSDGGARYNQNKENGVLICYKPAYEMMDYGDLYHRDFGNQNIGRVYSEVLIPSLHIRPAHLYDADLSRAYIRTLELMMNEPDMETAELYEYFLNSVKSKLPDLNAVSSQEENDE